MRKMKDSGIEWIGEIPESWKTKRNKQLFFEVNERCENGNEHTLLSVSEYYGIAPKSDKISDGEFETRAESLDGYKLCKVGDIVMNIMLAWKRSTGRSEYDGIVSPAYCVYRPIEDIDTKYYHYLFRTDIVANLFKQYSTGIIESRLRLYPEKFLALSMLVPPLPEQRAISAYLDRQCALIDSVTEKTKASIEEYKKLRQAVITQAVTKGVRGERPMKEVENGFLDHIPNNWIYQKVKNFIAMPVIDGPHESPELYDDGIPYISATAIVDSKIDFSLMRGYISAEYCDECDKRYKPQINDILLIKLGASTGQVAIVDTDRRFNIWVPLAAIRCDDSVVPKFIYYSFQSEYLLRQMELSWTYGTQQTLGVKTIEQLRFVLPIIDEQQEIAAYLDHKCAEIDALITKKETFLAELEAYKKSLIYEYVTGKKEVPQA